MKSEKGMTSTKQKRFYTKVCKIYMQALRARREMKEIKELLKDYKNGEEEYKVASTMELLFAGFYDDEYLNLAKKLSEIQMDRIAENERKIAEIWEKIDKKTSNSDIF